MQGRQGDQGALDGSFPFRLSVFELFVCFSSYHFPIERLLGGNETRESADCYRRNE